MADNLYTFGDRSYFTLPAELSPDAEFQQLLESAIPASWTRSRKSIWLAAAPAGQQLPLQGFKIHVSAIAEQSLEVIRKTLACCVKHNTSFKVVCRNDLAINMTSKSTGRSGGGKLLTLYPVTTDCFKALIHDLYLAHKDSVGPYILSDKRYLDSKVVHYRYGGFLLKSRQSADGTTTACIETPTGELVEDQRSAFYQLPDWVPEPFADQHTPSEEIAPLNQRYQVIEALAFSNSGGVYKAKDLRTGNVVVVKEARPHINFQSLSKTRVYADQVLKNEYRTLELMQGCDAYPQPVDFFVEWEHSFLVEEFVAGIPLRKFRASGECTLVPFTDAPESAERFKGCFAWVAKGCIEAVLAAHRRGVVLADISPNNIMVDAEHQRIRFIDFDGAYRQRGGEAEVGRDKVPVLTTPGFSDFDALVRDGSTYQGDWYALAMVLYSMMLPVQNQFDVERRLRTELLPQLVADCRLDGRIAEVIDTLAKGQPQKALALTLKLEASFNPVRAAKEAEPFTRLPNTPPRHSREQLSAHLHQISRFIASGVQRGEHSDFVPIDYHAFDLTPKALAYGYYGPALLLARQGLAVPQHLLDKIDAADDGGSLPGLLIGSAGMAMAELALGRVTEAERHAARAFASPLLSERNDFGYGLAGVGFMALALHQRTGIDNYLHQAEAIAETLAQRAIAMPVGVRYPQTKERDAVGLVHGSAGIALFLLQLHKVNEDAEVLALATASLAYDIEVGRQDDGSYRWGETADSTQLLPYWEYGSGGVGAVIARFYEHTGEAHYRQVLTSLAVTSFSRYSAAQGSFNGLAGLGELLLDIHRATGDDQYHRAACQIADSIVLFSVSRPEGKVYFGRGGFRLSTDLAHGSAGVGLFLQRLLTNSSRWLHDLAG
ncbi:class III lanthionine synthetase LanKC [Ferrimonas sp. SCSIO 43195]|uniref:class III lanthionine synthetase LanKC n=1 Tax=Ferrimonas sp. SCSIO 43195 TaxID=2822844 RepID=UPI002075617D|nr:class III lanthionine synthetase LanKC [Ferrimonas sp. SCSIO 43195]USD36543.1 class III lanthionine synthetase LanKC [Ferrimonas sp. SCSIO 43195]